MVKNGPEKTKRAKKAKFGKRCAHTGGGSGEGDECCSGWNGADGDPEPAEKGTALSRTEYHHSFFGNSQTEVEPLRNKAMRGPKSSTHQPARTTHLLGPGPKGTGEASSPLKPFSPLCRRLVRGALKHPIPEQRQKRPNEQNHDTTDRSEKEKLLKRKSLLLKRKPLPPV